jgi:8-oxo-dGTP pyrophosphatase MutT (NUDIX family)
LIREFSAGGVMVRRFRGRPFVAAVRVKGGTVLALPKGQIDAGESAAQAAAREVREEAGVEGELLEKLGDVRYWYQRDGERVLKVVSFFLFRYRSGTVRDHDSEVDSAEWVPLEDAPRLLEYRGERDMADAALSRWALDR